MPLRTYLPIRLHTSGAMTTNANPASLRVAYALPARRYWSLTISWRPLAICEQTMVQYGCGALSCLAFDRCESRHRIAGGRRPDRPPEHRRRAGDSEPNGIAIPSTHVLQMYGLIRPCQSRFQLETTGWMTWHPPVDLRREVIPAALTSAVYPRSVRATQCNGSHL